MIHTTTKFFESDANTFLTYLSEIYFYKYVAVYVAVPKQNTEYQYWKHTEVSLPV